MHFDGDSVANRLIEHRLDLPLNFAAQLVLPIAYLVLLRAKLVLLFGELILFFGELVLLS